MQGWLEQRRELYRQLKVQVNNLLGPESSGLKKYRAEYDRTFLRGWKDLSRPALLQRLNSSRVVLLSDFHALQQSQKTQLRILKGLAPRKKRVLALECVEARHQKKIDAFLSGKLSEFEFLKAVTWQDSWGFPWEFYKPLFIWAKSLRFLNGFWGDFPRFWVAGIDGGKAG